jgi:hypothetical protein
LRTSLPRLALAGALAAGLGLAAAAPAPAAPTTEVVTPADVPEQPEGSAPLTPWVEYKRVATPGDAAFVAGPGTPPLGAASLQLTTTGGSDKVYVFNFDHIGTPLADVDDIAYSTYRTSGSLQQVAALNLQVDVNGDAAGGFTTLVFEPVYNTDQGAVVSGEWQDWIADGAGRWWSTRPINGQCAFDCFESWTTILANNPDAVIVGGVGVNQGSGNPGLVTSVDAFTFDETTYDFELIRDLDGDGTADTDPPTSAEQCKKGGYAEFNNPSFRNQGQCVSYVNGRR